MKYRKMFDPGRKMVADGERTIADRRDGSAYVFSEETVLAVNVALATGRPLLLRGASGSGKSTLARSIAKKQGWRCLEKVVTSETKARHFLCEIDVLKRLQ